MARVSRPGNDRASSGQASEPLVRVLPLRMAMAHDRMTPGRGSAQRGDHACLLYGPGRERLAVSARFIAQGLATGERCLYVSPTLDMTGIVDALDREGVDVADRVAFGALRLATAARSYLAGGAFSPDAMLSALETDVRDSRAAGYTGLRATRDMSWALGNRTATVLLEDYERRLQRVFDAGSLTALCQYDRDAFPHDLLETMQTIHDVSVDDRRAAPAAAHERATGHEGPALRVAADGRGDLAFSAD